MVKKLISVIIILVILFGLAITEIILVGNFINELDEEVSELIVEYEENKDNVINVLPHLEELKFKWDKAEHHLCLMFNHKDMTSITDCLSRVLSYTTQNNYEEGYVELHLLKEYSEKNPHIMGCNWNNIL